MKRKRKSSQSRNRLGASAVEFAIVAPILLIFMFGMLELGRVMNVQNVLTNATREGARVAILNDMTEEEIKAIVEEYAAAGSINDGVVVEITPEDFENAERGTPITITAYVNFNDVSILPSPWFLANREISASTVMRREVRVSQ